MNTVAVMEESNLVYLNSSQKPVTTSRMVAEKFKKDHKNVIQAIETLDCSEEFARLNFKLAEYVDLQGKIRKQYELTRDGMTFLVMGFTGENASQFKEAYIIAFNKMEDHLRGIGQNLPQTWNDIQSELLKTVRLMQEDVNKLKSSTGSTTQQDRHTNQRSDYTWSSGRIAGTMQEIPSLAAKTVIPGLSLNAKITVLLKDAGLPFAVRKSKNFKFGIAFFREEDIKAYEAQLKINT